MQFCLGIIRAGEIIMCSSENVGFSSMKELRVSFKLREVLHNLIWVTPAKEKWTLNTWLCKEFYKFSLRVILGLFLIGKSLLLECCEGKDWPFLPCPLLSLLLVAHFLTYFSFVLFSTLIHLLFPLHLPSLFLPSLFSDFKYSAYFPSFLPLFHT